MSLKHGLLGLLNEKPMTGYELDKEFKASLRYFWQAKGSQIYNELDSMEKKGWLASERVIQDEKPNKRVYAITDEGRAEFIDWLSAPETDIKNAPNVKSAFLLRIYFGNDTNKEQALNMLRSFQDVCSARSIEMDNAIKELAQDELNYGVEQTTYWKLTVLYGEMMNQARTAWVEKAIDIVENMK